MLKTKIKYFKLDYSWVIVVLCFLLVATTLGFCSSGSSYYLTAITDALDISRGAFGLTTTIRYFVTTVLNIFFGSLIMRFGPKKLISAGIICLILFAYTSSVATTLFTFYLASLFLGIGLSWTTSTMTSAVINRWCKNNKATVTSAVLAANGIGGAIAVQIITPIIFQENNPFGYRSSYRLVMAILAVILLLFIIFFKDRPKDFDLSTENVKKKRKAKGNGWVGIEYANAIRKPYFYLSIISIFLTGIALAGLGGIAIPHLYDVGIDVGFVATVGSITSILLTVSKFSSGVIYSKCGMRICMSICFFCAFVSIAGLIVVNNSPLGYVVTVVRGIFGTFALPLETVMIPFFTMEFYGLKEYDKFIGILAAASTAGQGIGASFGNICYDIFGSYTVAFYIILVLLIFTTVAMQYVLSASLRERKKIEEMLFENQETINA